MNKSRPTGRVTSSTRIIAISNRRWSVKKNNRTSPPLYRTYLTWPPHTVYYLLPCRDHCGTLHPPMAAYTYSSYHISQPYSSDHYSHRSFTLIVRLTGFHGSKISVQNTSLHSFANSSGETISTRYRLCLRCVTAAWWCPHDAKKKTIVGPAVFTGQLTVTAVAISAK
ncbi:hypothetical protein BJV74DRAFT_989933 [Russula compacta]|nr:hypothetical protein BJV74DRAFT_989933 [Russula compacta]